MGGEKHGAKTLPDVLSGTRPVVSTASAVLLTEHGVAAESLLDGLPMAVVVLDTRKRVVFLNRRAEALLGISPADALGLPCCHVVRSARCLHACPLDRENGAGADADGADACDTDVLDRQRRKVPVRSSISPLRDAGGAVVGYMEVLEELREAISPVFTESDLPMPEGFISHSPAMQPLLSALHVIAETDSTVLITGETGTGKDLLAEAIHKASDRAGGPFVKVNCGALPEHLLESELFGHMRGAFTGAVSDKPGRFRLAAGGTLFLTEVGDLPLPLQVKLLTVLDDQCVHPLGATRPVSVDVRIIAATHRNLEGMVSEGRFREDLLFRLNVVRLHVPPLRERAGDVRVLLEHFLRRMAAGAKRPVQGFSPEALAVLCEYHWPGNVRELRNVVEYAVHFATGPVIGVTGLPQALLECAFRRGEKAALPDGVGVRMPEEAPESGAEDVASGHREEQGKFPVTTPEAHGAPPTPGTGDEVPARAARTEEDRDYATWEERERRMILDALARTGGRRQQAAKLLGWSRSTLWRKLNTHGLV